MRPKESLKAGVAKPCVLWFCSVPPRRILRYAQPFTMFCDSRDKSRTFTWIFIITSIQHRSFLVHRLQCRWARGDGSSAGSGGAGQKGSHCHGAGSNSRGHAPCGGGGSRGGSGLHGALFCGTHRARSWPGFRPCCCGSHGLPIRMAQLRAASCCCKRGISSYVKG